jgi:hypothetical protein
VFIRRLISETSLANTSESCPPHFFSFLTVVQKNLKLKNH